MWLLPKNRPMNELHALHTGPDAGMDARVEDFFTRYGLDESCAMSLAIACSTSAPVGATKASQGGAYGASETPGTLESILSQLGSDFDERTSRKSASYFARMGYRLVKGLNGRACSRRRSLSAPHRPLRRLECPLIKAAINSPSSTFFRAALQVYVCTSLDSCDLYGTGPSPCASQLSKTFASQLSCWSDCSSPCAAAQLHVVEGTF